MQRLKTFCREMLYGHSDEALKARYALLVMDVTIVAYFIVTTFLPEAGWTAAVDLAIGVVLLLELAGRVIADRDRVGLLSRPLAVIEIPNARRGLSLSKAGVAGLRHWPRHAQPSLVVVQRMSARNLIQPI